MKRALLATLTGLLLAGALQAETVRRKVAILVWPGAELLNFTGPAEVFWSAGRHRFFDVHVVGLDNGKFIPAAGVSAGIDAALHVVEKLCVREVAEWTAHEWMEYRGAGASENQPREKVSR